MLGKQIKNKILLIAVAGAVIFPLTVQAAGKATHTAAVPEKTSVVNNKPVKAEEKPKVRLVEPTIQRGQEISRARGDVDGDGVEEIVKLMGNPVVERSSYMGDLYVISEDSKTGKIKAFVRPKDLGGYNPYLSLTDVTGDGIPNVLITAPTGGSGGIVDYRIINFSDGKAEEIFGKKDNEGIMVKGRYLPDYRAEIFMPSLNRRIVMDLPGDRDVYRKLNIYNAAGEVLSTGIVPYTQDLCGLTTMDINGDGTDEVIMVQRVVGATNADTLGIVRTILDYRVGSWQPEKISFKANMFTKPTYGKEKDIIGDSGYEIAKRVTEIGDSQVNYPHFAKIGKGDSQWKINSKISNFVKDAVRKVTDKYGYLEMTYDVKYAGTKYASVLFSGVANVQNKATLFYKTFNFNVATGEEVTLEDMVVPVGEFWKLVKTESSKQNIVFTKQDVTGYFYDGAVLGLIYKGDKEFDLAQNKVATFLRKNKVGEKYLTSQSNEVKDEKMKENIDK